MILSLVVATAQNGVIGKDNQLIWHLPADLKFFKQTTMGCPVIMGRKTFQSIGRALPGRRNVVITRDGSYGADGVEVVGSIDAAIALVAEAPKVCVIGGSEIYRQTIHRADEIYRTLVHQVFDGDSFFPEISPSEFKLTWEEHHEPDEKNAYAYTFQKFERRKA